MPERAAGQRRMDYTERMEIVLLGTGTSHGVPMIACDCPTCTSDDPRDRRTRTGVWIRDEARGVLIDTPPELRLQGLRFGVDRVDAVLFTHAHADHIMGLDDLRRFNWLQKSTIPCLGTADTLAVIRRTFDYAFDPTPTATYRPAIELVEIDGDAPVEAGGIAVEPVPIYHGDLPILGFRVGGFAFLTDTNRIPDASLERLRDLDVLVLDALRVAPHPTHYSLAEAVEVATAIGARRTYFTHLTHEFKHAETESTLPETMGLAFDGLRFATDARGRFAPVDG